MGTYMDAFIEIDYDEGSPPFSDPVHIYSLTEGSFSFGKDYDVFDALAAGRRSLSRHSVLHRASSRHRLTRRFSREAPLPDAHNERHSHMGSFDEVLI